MAKEFETPNVSTQTPIGSHAEGFSFDSIMKEVDVMVNIKINIKLPSNWDLPLSFSGVKTTLLISAAEAPKNAEK